MLRLMLRKAATLAVAVLMVHLAAALPAQAAEAPAGKPIRIGLIAELSGPLGFYGLQTSNAAAVVVKQINSQGGLLGRPVELIVRDSQTTVSEAVRQARDLAFSENVRLSDAKHRQR